MNGTVLGCALRWTTAVWLLVAAWTKVADLRRFLTALEGYPWVPDVALVPLTLIVPALEAVVATALLLGRCRHGAWVLATGLGAVFVVWVGAAWGLGLDVRCGCFGGDAPLSGVTWLRSLVFFGVSALGLLQSWRARHAGSG